MMPRAALTLLARSGLLRFASAAQVRRWVAHASTNHGTGSPLRQHGSPVAPRQLLVDVSVIHQHDAGTGIQRVVRSVLAQLQANPPDGFTVRRVAAQSRRSYHYVGASGQTDSQKVQIQAGDVFLGLDLAAHLLPSHLAQLIGWKLKGVSLHFVVYDMLPLTHPAHFTAARVRHFQRWAQLIAMVSDSLLCISHSVKADLQRWLSQTARLTPEQIHTQVIPLGGDFYQSSQAVTQRPSAEVLHVLTQLQGKRWALMVGTLEPRKCHAQVLDAFEQLWREAQQQEQEQEQPSHQGGSVALVLVGRPGWHTAQLQQRISQHPQLSRQLFWFNAATDAELELFYQQSTGVVVASSAEGYGLPLSEALAYDKPLLTRDLPVFREVAGRYASYFSDDNPVALSSTLRNWFVAPHERSTANPKARSTWADATVQIVLSLGLVPGKVQHAAMLRTTH